MKNLIKKLLHESLLQEDLLGGNLYGYHVTAKKNLEAIKQNGLSVGHRAMQGAGLYAFYSYDHAMRYARKGEITDPIIIKFYVTSPNRFLYLNMDIAKEVLGSEYHLMTQIENYFYGGFDEFYQEVLKANPSISREAVIQKIQDIETDNTEMKQRTLLFSLIPSNLNDRLNIVWNGNYGLEFRINNPRYVKVVGYDVPDFHGQSGESHEFDFTDNIPSDSKYDILRDFLAQNPRLDSFDKAYRHAEDMYMNARNNRDFDYYQKLSDLLDTLK
ncbi:MAG: hypothetical protein E6R13_02860 [Spirochaetes bacterium]|nr:MAG: hypothetical protein E6R13_02860 [Spirochaetota bacterium]